MISSWISIANIIIYLGTIIANAFYGAQIGQTSDTYSLSTTPATYAFGIWGYIFVSLGLFSISLLTNSYYGWPTTVISNFSIITLAIGNIFNALWLGSFVSGSLLNAFLILSGLTISLFISYFASFTSDFSVALSLVIGVYLGWVLAATLLNFFIYLKYELNIAGVDNIAIPVVFVFYLLAMIVWYFVHAAGGVYNFNAIGFILSQTWAVIAVIVRLVS